MLADAAERVVDARRVAQVYLQLHLTKAEHVAVRVGQAGQEILAAAVDERRALLEGDVGEVSDLLDPAVLDDERAELLQAVLLHGCHAANVAYDHVLGVDAADGHRGDESCADPIKHEWRSVVFLVVRRDCGPAPARAAAGPRGVARRS